MALEALTEPNIEKMLKAGFVVRKLAKELRGGEELLAQSPLYMPSDYVFNGDRRCDVLP
nr:hypothetical protein [Stakelama marina]